MLSHRDPHPDNYTAAPRARPRQNFLRRWGLTIWAILMAISWLGYLMFLNGAPGNYWLAQAYSFLIVGAVPVVLVAVLTAPLFGLAFGLLAVVSLNPNWRSRARQGAQKLLVMLLIEVMAMAALLPSGIWVQEVTHRLAIAPGQVVYRAIYVSPLDDNYGDLMLVQCRWMGFCHQVYRSYTNSISAGAADLDFKPQTEQVALHLEGRWVYVRSPGAPACKEVLHSGERYGKCHFTPSQ